MTRSGTAYRLPPLVPRICETGCSSWPTPLAGDATGSRGSKGKDRPNEGDLQAAVRMWPTPQAHDAQKGYPERVGRYGTEHGGRNLNDEVLLPTPAARDFRSPNRLPYSERGGGKKGEQLHNAVGGQLNPQFVEYLMNFPKGWTDLTE